MNADRHFARVCLAQSRYARIKGHRAWGFRLLEWAGRARGRAAAPVEAAQMELFA